jgi:hypothetical protein
MPKALSFSDSAIPAILRLLVDKAPETTLAQLLADPSIGVLARGITLQQLAAALEHRTSDTATTTAPAAARTSSARRRSSTPRVIASAPTPAAAEYDAAILVEITAAPEPVGSVAIRTKTGGTPEQFRAAVERLIAAKKVKKSGVAKGTRYRAA